MNVVPGYGRGGEGAPTRLVELIGPAGCGKSALAAAFYDAAGHRASPVAIWGLRRTGLVRTGLGFLPAIVASMLRGTLLRPAEITQMIRVDTLRNVLDRGGDAVAHARDGTLLIDEGPVFALSWLEAFYPAEGSSYRTRWRERALSEWATRLTAVVRLDAEDATLVQRIRSRAKAHVVKELPEADINGFTRRFRRAFDRVVTELSERGGVRVITMRSDRGSSVELAGRLKAALDEPGQRRRISRPHLQLVQASQRRIPRLNR